MKKDPIILIVDDNLNFVDRVIDLLEAYSNYCSILVANDYEEAKRLFLAERPQLVLLDINLPGKSGIELLRFFKESERKVEVIMLTNHSDAVYKKQCIELGVNNYLDKSNDFSLLPGLVEKEVLIDQQTISEL